MIKSNETSDMKNKDLLNSNSLYIRVPQPLDTDNERKSFITRVFGLVMIQLTSNLVFSLLAILIKPIGFAITSNIGTGILYTIELGYILLIFYTLCNEDMLRRFPTNIYTYTISTICTSYMIATVCVLTNPIIVIQALSGTVLISSTLTVFAIQTKYDYSPWTAGLLCCTILVIFGSIMMSALDIQMLDIIFVIGGLIIFMLWVIIDVQMIVGNSHIRYKFDQDDYVLAAMCLYLDIINIFIKLIQLFQYIDN